MSTTLVCGRCKEEKPRLSPPPIPGELGNEIVAAVCRDCWAEWEKMEVMVINELRLNFMDPEAQKTLLRQMREFLALPAAQTPSATNDSKD